MAGRATASIHQERSSLPRRAGAGNPASCRYESRSIAGGAGDCVKRREPAGEIALAAEAAETRFPVLEIHRLRERDAEARILPRREGEVGKRRERGRPERRRDVRRQRLVGKGIETRRPREGEAQEQAAQRKEVVVLALVPHAVVAEAAHEMSDEAGRRLEGCRGQRSSSSNQSGESGERRVVPGLPVGKPLVEVADQVGRLVRDQVDRVRRRLIELAGGPEQQCRGDDIGDPDRLEIGGEEEPRGAEDVVAVGIVEVARAVVDEEPARACPGAVIVAERRECREMRNALAEPEVLKAGPPAMMPIAAEGLAAPGAAMTDRAPGIEGERGPSRGQTPPSTDSSAFTVGSGGGWVEDRLRALLEPHQQTAEIGRSGNDLPPLGELLLVQHGRTPCGAHSTGRSARPAGGRGGPRGRGIVARRERTCSRRRPIRGLAADGAGVSHRLLRAEPCPAVRMAGSRRCCACQFRVSSAPTRARSPAFIASAISSATSLSSNSAPVTAGVAGLVGRHDAGDGVAGETGRAGVAEHDTPGKLRREGRVDGEWCRGHVGIAEGETLNPPSAAAYWSCFPPGTCASSASSRHAWCASSRGIERLALERREGSDERDVERAGTAESGTGRHVGAGGERERRPPAGGLAAPRRAESSFGSVTAASGRASSNSAPSSAGPEEVSGSSAEPLRPGQRD